MIRWWVLLIGYTADASGTGIVVSSGSGCTIDAEGCVLSHASFALDGSTSYDVNTKCMFQATEDLTIGITKFRTEMNYDWVVIMDDPDVPPASDVCYGISPWSEDACLAAGCCRYDYSWGDCGPLDGFWDLPCVVPENAHSGKWCGMFQDRETCDEEKFAIKTGQSIS
jgi:hypothetical protein